MNAARLTHNVRRGLEDALRTRPSTRRDPHAPTLVETPLGALDTATLTWRAPLPDERTILDVEADGTCTDARSSQIPATITARGDTIRLTLNNWSWRTVGFTPRRIGNTTTVEFRPGQPARYTECAHLEHSRRPVLLRWSSASATVLSTSFAMCRDDRAALLAGGTSALRTWYPALMAASDRLPPHLRTRVRTLLLVLSPRLPRGADVWTLLGVLGVTSAGAACWSEADYTTLILALQAGTWIHGTRPESGFTPVSKATYRAERTRTFRSVNRRWA